MPGRRKIQKVEKVALEKLPKGVHSARVTNPSSGRRGGPYGTGWSPDDEIVALVAELMVRGWRDRDVHDYIKQYAGKQMGKRGYGSLAPGKKERWWYDVPIPSINKIKEDARVILRDRVDLDKPLAQGTAVSFYEQIKNDPASTPTERLRAQERIDAILGLDAKFGGTGVTAEKLAADIREAGKAIEDLMAQNPAPESEEPVKE